MDLVFMEYDDNYVASHKASSITSVESGDHPPSLYSGHADSCSSLCDPDEPPVFEDSQPCDTISLFKHHGGSISIPLTEDGDYDPLSFFYHDQITQVNLPCSLAIQVINDNQEATIPHDDGSSTFESNENKRSSTLTTTLLSQDEKRVNHIASEQKRRQNIRIGFQQLTELIPALRNVPHRKSTILFKTADYIKHTEKRNKILRERLKQLQRRLSASSSVTAVISASSPSSPSSPSSSSSSSPPAPSLPSSSSSSLQLLQIRQLQEQLLRQQELLQQHNIPHRPFTYTSHHHHHLHQPHETKAIIMPVSDDDNDIHQYQDETPTPQHYPSMMMMTTMINTSYTPCLNIPADEEFGQESMIRERLLSCGKLKLKHSSSS